jgi:hypothetical protein
MVVREREKENHGSQDSYGCGHANFPLNQNSVHEQKAGLSNQTGSCFFYLGSGRNEVA